MGANIKKLRTRIKSVTSTSHLTKAMGLVASSKIRRAMMEMKQSREYANALEDMISALVSSGDCAKSPYILPNESCKTKILLIAGDRGMAGGYNANVFKLAKDFPDAEIIPLGKRATERFGTEFVSSEKYFYGDAIKLAKEICGEFRNGELNKFGIIFTKYVNAMKQEANIEWILPFKKSEESTDSHGTIFEPNEEVVLETAVPEYVAGKIIYAVKESFASEVAARRTAMDSAGKNAKVMLDDLGLKYNRARQGAITQEITEIVAGSDS